MTKEQAIEILTNALQSDESKYTAEIDKALSVVQKVFAKIPEKHGRLIDENDILNTILPDEFNDKNFMCSIPLLKGKYKELVKKQLEYAPTIVEAEDRK